MPKPAPRLLTPDRERRILESLGDRARSVAELSRALRVSEATVRRDLDALARRGKVRRVHGGAERVRALPGEPVFTEKASLRAAEKERIAELALGLVADGDTIYLDGGSTVLALARRLGEKRDLTVITNSLMAAAELMESGQGHRLILLGGEFRALSRTLVGPLTEPVLARLHPDKAFMGTIGFTAEEGISTTDANEAFTKERVMRRARQVVLLADAAKLGHPSLVTSGEPGDIDILVTDAAPPPALAKQIHKLGIKIVH
jgi:DeoR/GlpR family transcriptional regulator of sugar metabolism